jgi:hypothetical protein
MSEVLKIADEHVPRPWYRNRKLDQWICFWSVPFFFSLFGVVFVPLSWMMPPPGQSGFLVSG